MIKTNKKLYQQNLQIPDGQGKGASTYQGDNINKAVFIITILNTHNKNVTVLIII